MLRTTGKRFIILTMLLGLMQVSSFAYASAGKVIFAMGNVTAQDANGNNRSLSRGETVYQGDTLITGNRSILQIRMNDRAFISMRANSQFRIDEFVIGTKKEDDRSLFSLLKGGLRTATGIIGKRSRKAYRLRTQVATIGIRGTDFSARLCNKDCKSEFESAGAGINAVRDGLYLGVLDGGINISNELGTLDIDRLQYAFVATGEAPRALLKAPDFLMMKSSRPKTGEDSEDSTTDTDAGTTAKVSETRSTKVAPPPGDISNDQSIQNDLVVDSDSSSNAEIEETKTTELEGETDGGGTINLINNDLNTRRAISISTGAITSTPDFTNTDTPLDDTIIFSSNSGLFTYEGTDPNGNVVLYSNGTASNVNLGFDPTTGISWGRWVTGNFNSGADSVALGNQSLHWVASPEYNGNIALPSSGTASYNLVGNTNPTDSNGNIGVLGNATLNADFVNMTATTGVTVGINNEVWNGSSSAMPIANDGTFGGALNVDVNNGATTGSGTASGFFTPAATGAGMGFNMEAGGNRVNGTAIFQRQ